MNKQTTTPALTRPPPPAQANDPWGSAGPKAGKEHCDKIHVAGHLRRDGSNRNKMYTRACRLLSSELEIHDQGWLFNARKKNWRSLPQPETL